MAYHNPLPGWPMGKEHLRMKRKIELMMHKGEIVRDLGGEAKKRLRPDDLLAHFDQVRRREMLDESAAAMLREQYI